MISADGLRARARVLRALRRWFDAHGYLEVPTPSLVPSPALEENLFALGVPGHGQLRTSPEFALKRVLASGLHRVYEIGPCFRAREHGPWHRTEFWMLEWYRAGAAPSDVMDEVEDLVARCAEALDVPAPDPWRRVAMRTLFRERGVDPWCWTPADHPHESWDDAMLRCWVDQVEPHLDGALVITDWPESQAALARVRTDVSPPVAQRFEVFLDGHELANAFFELIDPVEQRRRFQAANAHRIAMGEAPHPVDEALIEAVGRMPSTTGIAMGVDRLVAVLMGWDGIGPGRVERDDGQEPLGLG